MFVISVSIEWHMSFVEFIEKLYMLMSNWLHR